ncbi:UNVERIFIED_CONTAM: hypothetical protein FKN15_065096 [Acipenser sinensis]
MGGAQVRIKEEATSPLDTHTLRQDVNKGAYYSQLQYDGCGTGKYLSVNNLIYNLGCDYCSPLVEKARKQGHEVLVCDNLHLPFRDQVFNAVISIGVIHHFSTKERRIRAIREIARTIIPGGMVMIYAWALEQKRRRFEKQDVFVPWNKALCSRNPSESGRGRQPIDIRLSVMAVTRRGLPIESITGAEALVESCGDGEPQKKKRATEQSISSSRGETLGSPVYER